MKKTLLLLLLSLAIVACSTQRPTVAERIVRDTVYYANVLHDSVYVSHWLTTDRTRDTLLIMQHDTLIKKRSVHDTIHVYHYDSIPYPVTIEKREEVPRPLHLIDYLAYASLVILLILILHKLRQMCVFR